MRTKADEELLAKTMWCSLVAKAARAVRGDPPPLTMIEGVKVMNHMEEAGEDNKETGLQGTWPRFLEAMWLDSLFGTLVTWTTRPNL